jgi:hypothetical protein
LLQAQQDAVFTGPLRRAGAHHIPKVGERPNGVLGIIAIPGNVVVIEEGKELVSISFNLLPQC